MSSVKLVYVAMLFTLINSQIYLAQEREDVSRRPLKIACGELIDESLGDGIECDAGFSSIEVYGFDGSVGTEPNSVQLKGTLDGSGYDCASNDDPETPILLKLGATDLTTFAREQVKLIFQTGDEIDVYLPVLKFDGEQTYLLWVAEDGSTYWARNYDPGPDGDTGTEDDVGRAGSDVELDALTSMQVLNQLACGAYDARLYRYASKSMAQSPAIDRGTDDAYGYDSTSTHPKVIDMGQPDIGYHYYRRVADDDPIYESDGETLNQDREIRISFREPGDPSIERYVVNRPPVGSMIEPELIEEFDPDLAEDGVIEDAIVNKDNQKLTQKIKYALEAFSERDGVSSAKVGFIVIVDPDKPTISVE